MVLDAQIRVCMRNRLPLQCIRREQGIRGRGADHAGQLPSKVVSILKARVEAESTRGGELVGCIAGQENTALLLGFDFARSGLGGMVFWAYGPGFRCGCKYGLPTKVSSGVLRL